MENQKTHDSKNESLTKTTLDNMRKTSIINLSQRPMRSMNRSKSFKPWQKIKINNTKKDK